MERNNIFDKETASPKTVFVPNARALSNEALKTLPDKEKPFAQDCEDKGVWLELFCPDDSCLLEGERIKLVDFCEDTEERHDLWLKIFCPNGSCELTEYTQLP